MSFSWSRLIAVTARPRRYECLDGIESAISAAGIFIPSFRASSRAVTKGPPCLSAASRPLIHRCVRQRRAECASCAAGASPWEVHLVITSQTCWLCLPWHSARRAIAGGHVASFRRESLKGSGGSTLSSSSSGSSRVSPSSTKTSTMSFSATGSGRRTYASPGSASIFDSNSA